MSNFVQIAIILNLIKSVVLVTSLYGNICVCRKFDKNNFIGDLDNVKNQIHLELSDSWLIMNGHCPKHTPCPVYLGVTLDCTLSYKPIPFIQAHVPSILGVTLDCSSFPSYKHMSSLSWCHTGHTTIPFNTATLDTEYC